VEFNLNKVLDNKINIHINLRKAHIGNEYLFPVSIPGTYEKRNYSKYSSSAKGVVENDNRILLKKVANGFSLLNKSIKELEYQSTQSRFLNGLFYPEDTYFSDSLFLLNWNVLVGYFENTSNSYQIKIIKPKELLGATSMIKKSINDTIDIYTASSYSELIHSPVMYTKADTASFCFNQCLVKISCFSTDPRYNSASIKQKVKPVLEKCLSDSHHIPTSYSILCLIDDFKMSNSLIALEHPNSTVICFPTIFKDTTILMTTIAHEFCHTLFTPLYVRSEKIEQFNYQKPLCDKHLWFYEGCVEYLSRKKSFQTGVIDTVQFIKALHSDFINMDNVNLLKTSENVYSKKGQEYYMDFYTKGSLVAFLLDLELITKSNYKISLSDLMNKMQNYQEENGPFDEDGFLELLSQLSNIDLSSFFEKYLNSTCDIYFNEALTKINYKIETKQLKDSLAYTYSINSLGFKSINNETIIILKKTDINKQLGIKELTISKIDNEPISLKMADQLLYPKQASIELEIIDKGIRKNVTATSKEKKMYERVVNKLVLNESELSEKYWKE
jgi:predicted metalloprotease with PDZ domain